MSATLVPNCKTTTSIGRWMVIAEAREQVGTEPVQEKIWQLQDEVRMLQEELVRTRRALDQRVILLKNARQRELELRAASGADGR